MIHEYIAYLKDNPEHLWFKRKLYGWGWTPATKEGWYTLLGFIIAIFAVALRLDSNASADEVLYQFFLPLILLVSALLYICYKKGEKPKWQWGIPKQKDKVG